MQIGSCVLAAFAVAALATLGAVFAQNKPVERQVLKLTDVQKLHRPAGALIITSDQEMEKLALDPNMKVKAFDSHFEDIAKGLEGCDGALINVAYDFFFGGDQRKYFPTSPECIRAFKALHDVARKHGVGFGASILNPLDLGPAYYREKSLGGRTCQFQEGALNPDGTYSVPMRVQRQWFHNKGPVPLHVSAVKAFAFSENRIGDTSYYAVDPAQVVDISKSPKLEVDEKTAKKSSSGYAYVNGVVAGRFANADGRNRVLAVIIYDVEEMDYFHPDALPFLKNVLDAHKAAGITYDSFYSDEMHIQFDWDLGTHFGTSEINTRYVTPGLVEEYSRLHGDQYRDFDKFLVYFAFAQHSLDPSGEPEMAQNVFGPVPSDIYATWKFRRDYFRLLTDQVVDLFVEAKRYGEKIFNRELIWTRAHATWQESPTCDHVDARWKPKGAPISRYDYTPAYDWSSSIRENVSACYDYFRWGDFLTGMGNDFPEGGWIDRNYYGAAMTASFGAFNDVPYSYWGHSGAPAPVSQRVFDVAEVYGLAGPAWGAIQVQGWQHRQTPVLALYPSDLNYVEERYGSWMVQYGYCDYLTEEKFAPMATVLPNGHFMVKDREYSTLLVLFEPMILRDTLKMIAQIGKQGGKVLWTGPPPAIYHEDGADATADWKRTFGIQSVGPTWNGVNAEGTTVRLTSDLQEVPGFRIPTHLLVDRVYPAEPAVGTKTAASMVNDNLLGTIKDTEAGGHFVYFGAHPRDDQSGSTPDAPRTLYHLLHALGSYNADGPGWPEEVSNASDFVVCQSPNGAVSIGHHYYKIAENWPGGFFRAQGEKFDESRLPSSRLAIKNAKFGPYRLTHDGDRVVVFRTEGDVLIAFSGQDTQGITINGKNHKFADIPANIAFAPLPQKQLAPGVRHAWFVQAAPTRGHQGELILRLPIDLPNGAKWISDPKGNGRGVPSPASIDRKADRMLLHLPPEKQGIPVYLFVEDR